MNVESRATKLYLKSLAPNEAIDLIDSCNLPSPYREILITACVHRKTGFAGIDYLADNFNINISYWVFVKNLKQALIMFRKSLLYKEKK